MQGVDANLVVHGAGRSKKLAFLARCRRLYLGELRADFRRYYSCSYSEVERLSPVEAADLAFFLPEGSRLKAAIDPAYAWTREERLLAAAVNAIAALGGAKKPPITVPEPRKAPSTYGVDVDQLESILSKPRKEVTAPNGRRN